MKPVALMLTGLAKETQLTCLVRVVVAGEGGGEGEDGVQEGGDLGVCEPAEGDERVVLGAQVVAPLILIVVIVIVVVLVTARIVSHGGGNQGSGHW